MVKRGILLILGVAGSVAVCAVLIFSSQSILASASTPKFSQLPESEQFLTLPIAITGTDLAVQRLVAYEGPFLEDGSDREVVDIAALLICNTGDETLLRAQVELTCGGRTYRFYGERILPGIPQLLLERNCKPYEKGEITACSGWQITTHTREYLDRGVTVTDEYMGTLVITNSTENTLRDVTVFYRSWLSPPGFYIGGIVYFVTLPTLAPGEAVRIYPYRYAKEYSRPVSVTASRAEATNEPAAN